jgi:phosphohistidine swiveling domain-containing protein
MSSTAIRSPSIRRLADVGLSDVAEVGGKAANLGELIAAGVRVPDGVVLTAGSAALTPDERGSLVRASTAKLGSGPFAVRSSGIAEDGAERSYAGMFESELNVSANDVPAATERCLASAAAGRIGDYESAADIRLAVIIQRMVPAAAAGVMLTADPINGDRGSCVITAVRGVGDRLVSGTASGDEWTVRDDVATARRQPEHAIDADQARHIAAEARRIADGRGTPQDIEWAIDGEGLLWIVQARPMTALPPDVSWEPPAPGFYTRTYRFGEWISEPVTPLFESWLLSAMEERTHAYYRKWLGQVVPRPYHVVVNGWYFYSMNWSAPRAMLRNLPRMLVHFVRTPRVLAGIVPSAVRHSIPILERMWREDLQPRYRAAVASAEGRVEALPVAELPTLIDELAELAGEYFASVTALTGAAYKMEWNLAGFYRKHLRSSLGGSHLPLLVGLALPADPSRHAVESLDWWHPTAPTTSDDASRPEDRGRLADARGAAEAAAFATLASSPRRLKAFQRMLADTQHLVPVRDEQARELTIAWPAMRRSVLRIGETLAARGSIERSDDVYFLTRAETLAALDGGSLSPKIDVARRRAKREEQGSLMAPMFIGKPNRILMSMLEGTRGLLGAIRSETALVSGTPASPGRASGMVRVVRGAQEFDELQPGEILVAPLTAPAWTPLFTRAAAVVTDVGSAAAHASIIAREYGIPAVVGCVDATARLRTGMRVTVDGSTGNVEPA